MRLAIGSLLLFSALGSEPRISRPVHFWEFMDAVGPRAGLLGNEQGTLEAFIYPLKVFRDFELVFVSGGNEIPAARVARRIISTPGHYSIIYTGDDFCVTETLAVPMNLAGAIIHLDIDAKNPLRIDARFVRDFQLMWPASFGSAYGEWNERAKAFYFGADGQPYAAVFGSPDSALVTQGYATNYSSSSQTRLTLGTARGHAERVLAVAGSMKSRDEAVAIYRDLTAQPAKWIAETDQYYRDLLAGTVNLKLPDAALEQAYDWSRVSAAKGFVDNPLLGKGLVAGYGPSKGGYRPGFAWFFGRDSFWTSFALTAAGDLVHARQAIEFVARFQRDDGKMPHEIAQSASVIPWFKQFIYGYNAADAGPLFITAVRDYVQASGDVAFARELEPRLRKSMQFSRSTFDAEGFPKNVDVGPGWVEGGPLLPVRLEIYQAGCYLESVRSLAWLARLLNQDALARELDAEFEQKKLALNRLFWMPDRHSYAFALDLAGKQVAEASVLATVPMWFGLLDAPHAQDMIRMLSGEKHAADWGMRIISAHSPLYDPSGYHFGSVWPLFTGWASVGEYRYHSAQPAFANLRANAHLAVTGAGGNTTEVLSGDSATPLSTASPHQTWSAAMVVSPLLRGLAGLEPDAVHKRLVFAPHLPADWPSMEVNGLPIASAKLNLALRRDRNTLDLTVANSGAEPIEVEFAPAYPPCAKLTSVTVDGGAVTWKTDLETIDWHARITFTARQGVTKVALKHSGVFGYAVPYSPAGLAEPSSNLKVISERWSNNSRTLELILSGLAGRAYRVTMVGGDLVESVTGASREGSDVLSVQMKAGAAGEYVEQSLRIQLR